MSTLVERLVTLLSGDIGAPEPRPCIRSTFYLGRGKHVVQTPGEHACYPPRTFRGDNPRGDDLVTDLRSEHPDWPLVVRIRP